MDSTQTAVERMDEVRRYFDAGRCSREAAIREIRAAIGEDRLTEVGAADLLDGAQLPSERYTAALRPLQTAAWDTSGWEITFTPTARCGVRCWSWSLANRRDRTAKPITGLALTDRAAHRRAWRAWQKVTCS